MDATPKAQHVTGRYLLCACPKCAGQPLTAKAGELVPAQAPTGAGDLYLDYKNGSRWKCIKCSRYYEPGIVPMGKVMIGERAVKRANTCKKRR